MSKSQTEKADNSKEWMADSLLLLMKRKKFRSITISDIAQKAGIDRRTFYRHFSSKEDIIQFKINKLAKDYEKLIISHKNFKTKAVLISFYTICEKEKEFLLCLYKNNLLLLLLREFETLFEIYFIKHKKIDPTIELTETKYMLAYHTGGFWNVLNKWLSEGANKTPDEIIRILVDTLPELITIGNA
ncbi:MAG: TetR/AcrR family transcriptional regulator [Treponema sp.]|nr:TetR/AcrR family transcriptional regulator [Treponema sp.]